MKNQIIALFKQLSAGLTNGSVGSEQATDMVEDFLYNHPQALVIMPELKEELELIISNYAQD